MLKNLILLLLVAGCGTQLIPDLRPQGPRFCLVEEKRSFTQDEFDWRVVNAPWNLNRDLQTNTTYEDADCDAVLARASK